MPRRGINVHDNEVMRAFKTVNDGHIEPISFTVPRRAETFQADIFPPAVGSKPACSAKEWLDGKTGIPAKLDLEAIYEGNAPKEIASDYKAPPKFEPVPAVKPVEKKEEPKPAPAARSPPSTMKDQKSSIANMANKYQDNEGSEEEEDDDSSFEEISRPTQRAQQPVPTKPVAATPRVQTQPTKTSPPIKVSSPIKSPVGSSTPTHQTVSLGDGAVESSLDQLKHMIENQTRLISTQNEKIGQLVAEVDSLKKKVGTADQSERIRQLELELEEARS